MVITSLAELGTILPGGTVIGKPSDRTLAVLFKSEAALDDFAAKWDETHRGHTHS